MGTRYLTIVIYKGDPVVAQYGQWDGYLESAGVDVCSFIERKLDIPKFKQALSDCKFISDEEVEKLWEDCGSLNNGQATHAMSLKFEARYPALHRSTGCDVLEMIQDHGFRKLQNNYNFAADSLYCEWAYLLDLDNEVLEIYKGFNKQPLPDWERFSKLPIGEDAKPYYQISLFAKRAFSEVKNEWLVGLIKQEEKANET